MTTLLDDGEEKASNTKDKETIALQHWRFHDKFQYNRKLT
jgi:hypothetical protein